MPNLLRVQAAACLRSVAAAALALSCAKGAAPSGGNKFDIAAFAGQWDGVLSATAYGQTYSPPPTSLILLAVDSYTVEIVPFCADGSGPRAVATSPTTLSVAPFTCKPTVTSYCPALTRSLTNGTGTLRSGALVLTLNAVEVACGSQYKVVFEFTSGQAESLPPIASAQVRPSSAVSAYSQVVLDASGSSDPLGEPLAYSWSLGQIPWGSAANLIDSNSVTARLIPDVPGTYLAKLTVTAGGRSSARGEATILVIGEPSGAAPRVRLSAPLSTIPGQSLSLDASASQDSRAGGNIAFVWVLEAAPAGSAATLVNPNASIASLTPDLAGTYRVSVTVSDGTYSASVVAEVLAEDGVTSTLPYRPLGARYSRTLDRLVLTSDSPPAVHLYDPQAKTDQIIALRLKPNSLSLSSDGRFAAVGHDAWVSYLDLTDGTLIATWPVSTTVGNVVLGDPITIGGAATRFAYAFPAGDFGPIHNLDLGSGLDHLSEQVFGGIWVALRPGSANVIGITNLNPPELEAFTADVDGVLHLNPTTGLPSNRPRGPLWISGAGTELITGSGQRYRTDDLAYSGTLTGLDEAAAVVWADASPDGKRWLVQPALGIPGYNSSDDGAFLEVDSQYLTNPSLGAYPPYSRGGRAYSLHGRWAFYDRTGAHKVVVAQVDSSAGLPLDFTVLVF